MGTCFSIVLQLPAQYAPGEDYGEAVIRLGSRTTDSDPGAAESASDMPAEYRGDDPSCSHHAC